MKRIVVKSGSLLSIQQRSRTRRYGGYQLPCCCGHNNDVGDAPRSPPLVTTTAGQMTRFGSLIRGASPQPHSTTYFLPFLRAFSSTTTCSTTAATPAEAETAAVSSAPSPSSHRSVLQQATTRLLKVPIGSLDEKQWSEAHYAILGCLEMSTSSLTPSVNADGTTTATVENIVRAFELLDRLCQEEKKIREDYYNMATTSPFHQTIPSFFHTDLLNLVVNHWRKGIVSGQLDIHHPTNSGNECMSTMECNPKNVLQRIYRYQESTCGLQPDFQTYAMIIDTMASLVAVSSSVSANTVHNNHGAGPFNYGGLNNDWMALVEEIIEWLVNQARRNSISNDEELPNRAPFSQRKSSVRPNVVVFSSAMNAWVKSGRREAPTKVEELLGQMKALKEEFPSWGDIAPNKFTYTTAIDAWAKAGNVEKVHDLVQEMYQVYQDTQDDSIKPGLHAFNGYLVALSKQARTEEAEATLSQMEGLYDAGQLDEPPNVISYSTVLDGFARSKDEESAFRAEAFLRRMIDVGKVAPNAVSYNSVIFSHVQHGNIQAAESLLQEMHDAYLRSGSKELRPTLETYSSVLSGLAKSRRKDSGRRAERILEHLKEMAKSGDLDKPPDIVLYNAVLDCWAKSSAPESAARVKLVLDQMSKNGISADVISYNTVIHCMAKSGRLREAQSTLEGMEGMGVQPNGLTYNTLLSAYTAAVPFKTKNQQRSSSQFQSLAHRVEKLFEQMKQKPNVAPDIVTYNTILNFYTRVGDVDKVEALLREMLSKDSTIPPDSTSMNTVINAWASSGRPDAPEQAEAIFEQILVQDDREESKVSPTSVTFNSVMSAWTKSRRPEAAERCQHFFDLMRTNFASKMRPDFVTFNILIHAWSLSTDESAPDHAERAYEEMQQRYKDGEFRMRPNVKTFGALINVWSKSDRPNAGERAESYLRKIVEDAELQHATGDLPRVYEFTSTIRAWARSGDPRAPYKADAILYLLLQQVDRGNKLAQPDSLLFGAFLSTLADSRVPNKPIYANRAVQMMKDFKIRPNRFLLEQLKRCHGLGTTNRDVVITADSRSQAVQ